MKAECRACKKVWTVKDRFDPSLAHDCPEVDDWEAADTLIVRRATPPAISFYETPSPEALSPPASMESAALSPSEGLAKFKADVHWQALFRHVWQNVSLVAEVLASKEGSIDDGSCSERPWIGVFKMLDGRYFVTRGTLHFSGWSGSSLAGKVCYGDFFTSLDSAKRLGLSLEEYALLFPEEMWTG